MRQHVENRPLTTVPNVVCAGLIVCITVLLPLAASAGSFYSMQRVQSDRLSSSSPLFANYDGDGANALRTTREWPVNLIFYGNATVRKTYDALNSIGISDRSGSREYEPWKPDANAHLRFNSSLGAKSGCNGNTDMHVRVYSPGGAEETAAWSDPFRNHGSFVVATTHEDIGESQCGGQAHKVFGYSELVENSVINALAPNYFTQSQHAQEHNYEGRGPREIKSEPGHVWWSNGLASAVVVQP